MICIDEFGPLELRPQGGSNWSRRKHPDRLPATYTRPHGVRHLFAAYDLARDRLYGHIKRRKRWQEFLSFLKYIRKLYSKSWRLYLILDNFSPHRKSQVLQYARKNNIELVWTPTYASWLNRIECHFTPLRTFALTNCFHRSHRDQARGIRRYIAWRNRHPRCPEILKEQQRKKLNNLI